MPQLVVDELGEIRHSDDIQDIITAPPSWLLKWGISLFFAIIILIITLSAFIQYPDIIKAQLRINAVNTPKMVVAKISGRLTQLIVHQGQHVYQGQPIGYLESTADHKDVLILLAGLQQLQSDKLNVKNFANNILEHLNLGELQPSYQIFYQNLLIYKSSLSTGILAKRRNFLIHDLSNLEKQQQQLTAQKKLQSLDLKVAYEEYGMHKQLAADRAETKAELREAESRYLSKQAPLIQTDAAVLSAINTYSAKQKEIAELDNQLLEERSRFQEALGSLISQAEEWKSKYVLTASQPGLITFAGIIQTGQVLQAGQEICYINSNADRYFGEVTVPQINMGKVKAGQEVLIKLHSYPFEQYGMIRGHITSVNEVPYKDSIFFSQVKLNKQRTDLKYPVHLKQGMMADAEIITEEATILQRIIRNLLRITQMH